MNLHDYVDQKVEITFRNGHVSVATIIHTPHHRFDRFSYTTTPCNFHLALGWDENGSHYDKLQFDIVNIKPMKEEMPKTISSSHPFSTETIDKMANEIVANLINNLDSFDVFSEVAGEIVNEYVPYNKEKTANNDLHVELSGAIVEKLFDFLKKGFNSSN